MANHIDLTSDSPDDFQNFAAPSDAARYAKRPRTYPPTQEFTPSPSASQISSNMSTNFMPPFLNPPFPSPPILSPSVFAPSAYISGFSQPHYRPPFAGHIQYSPANNPALPSPPLNDLPYQSASTSCQPAERDIIDLTSSPSPPPPPMTRFSSASQPSLPPDLPPKTPVCIGQLSATALILYPILYTMPQTPAVPEWVPVRFEYESSKTAGKEAIHIKSPSARGPSGESIPGESFGVIEQKVANYLGPMLGRGLIRLDSKICRGSDVCPMPSFFLNILTLKQWAEIYFTSSDACLYTQRQHPSRWKLSSPM
jgi:SWI/SNF-related matrix-associated actin-dependent regulator of chromatin subfamily A3